MNARIAVLGRRKVLRITEFGEAWMRWCATHSEVVWVHLDGSFACPHDMVIEARSEHEVTELPFTIGRKP